MTSQGINRLVRRSAVVLTIFAVFAAGGGCAAGASGPAPAAQSSSSQFRFFSPSSFWNKSLEPDAPLATNSEKLVRALNNEVTVEWLEERGPSINTTKWSVPIYEVPANQPTVRVAKVDGEAAALQAAWSAVPLPPDAKPAAGTDRHLVVWQPSGDRLWEFWHLEKGSKGWRAPWGGAIEHLSEDPGVYTEAAWPGASPGWGASAPSFSIAGGLITLKNLSSGWINHALALGLPQVRAGVFALPAHRTDGESRDPLSLPEGAHLRLDPSLDIDSLHLPRLTRMIAEAAQRYGIVVRSKAGNVDFYGQDPSTALSNPYTRPNGYFEGEYRHDLLAQFPWSHLQVLRMHLQSEE
jgi:hypothetical protein